MQPTPVTDSTLQALGARTPSAHTQSHLLSCLVVRGRQGPDFPHFPLAGQSLALTGFAHTEAALAPPPGAGLVFPTSCPVRTAGLPEPWLRMAACPAPFPLSASLSLARLTPFSLPHPPSQTHLGPLFSLPAWFACNLPASPANTGMGSEHDAEALVWLALQHEWEIARAISTAPTEAQLPRPSGCLPCPLPPGLQMHSFLPRHLLSHGSLPQCEHALGISLTAELVRKP